jgi:hypothetical protein
MCATRYVGKGGRVVWLVGGCAVRCGAYYCRNDQKYCPVPFLLWSLLPYSISIAFGGSSNRVVLMRGSVGEKKLRRRPARRRSLSPLSAFSCLSPARTRRIHGDGDDDGGGGPGRVPLKWFSLWVSLCTMPPASFFFGGRWRHLADHGN